MTAGVVEPRYPSFKGIMAAKSKPVDAVTAADLGVERRSAGPAPARRSWTWPPPRPARPARSIEDDGEGYLKVVEFLEGLKVI